MGRLKRVAEMVLVLSAATRKTKGGGMKPTAAETALMAKALVVGGN